MRYCVSLLAALLAAMAVPSAQTPSGQAAAGQPVFRSGVDLVRFDLSVVDANGKPITDVRPDEIQIVEDGQPRPIVLFQRVQEPAGFYTDAAIRAVSAEVTSNDAAPRGHLYIFIFDQQHITPGNEQYARQSAAEFIRKRVRASDRVAIFGIPGPGPDLQFTADRQRALGELVKVRGGYEAMLKTPVGNFTPDEAYQIAAGNTFVTDAVTRRIAADLSSDTGSSLSDPTVAARATTRARSSADEDPSISRRLLEEDARAVVQQQDNIARDFLERLTDLMAQFRDVDGRKTVVLFSEGFHDPNVSRELQDVAAAAAQSYAVFYAMDLNRRNGGASVATTATTAASTEIQTRVAPLASLALETDGMFVNDASAHLDDALARIANQSQDYYIAGFLPSEKALAERGSYRRIQIRVKRPGARVSARTGYAVPLTTTMAADRRGAIDTALAAPFAQQALKVSYTTYVLRSEATGHPRVVLSLSAELPLKDEKRDAADVVFVVRDARDGHVAASGSDTMPLPSTAVPGELLGRGSYRVQFEVPPGSYLMRAVVREPGGLLGSADRRLDVRDVAGPSIAASDMVFRTPSGTVPVRAEAFTRDGLNGGFEIYGRTPEQLAHVKVRVTLAQEDGTARETVDADLAEPESVAGGSMRRATFNVPLTGVQPGGYVAKAVVLDGSEEAATVTRQFDVVTGEAPVAAAPTVNPLDVTHGPVFARARGEWVTAAPALAAHANKGFELYTAGNFASAAPELEQAFDAAQRNAATAFVLGWAWEGAGDERRAIGAWRAAAAADPTLISAHLALADAYLRLRQPALAAQALKAGLAAKPDSPELKAKLEQIGTSR